MQRSGGCSGRYTWTGGWRFSGSHVQLLSTVCQGDSVHPLWVGVTFCEPESHTKSYLEGKFPVICRGGSENLKILRRIVSVQWRSTGSWDGAIQSGYCLFCYVLAHLRRDAEMPTWYTQHLHFIYMKFIKRVFGSRQHSQQVPGQSLTSTEWKNKTKRQQKMSSEFHEFLKGSWTSLVYCEAFRGLTGHSPLWYFVLKEKQTCWFQTCPGGLPRISSCVSVQRATSLAKDVVVTCLMVLRCQ